MGKEKDILDVLSDTDKVEKIASFPTAKDVEVFLEKEEKIKVDTKDITVLGDVLQEAVDKGAEAVDEKKLASIGGGFSLKKAAIAAGVIGTAVGGGYLADKYLNDGKGMGLLKTGAGKAKEQINTWFGGNVKRPILEIGSAVTHEELAPETQDAGVHMDF